MILQVLVKKGKRPGKALAHTVAKFMDCLDVYLIWN